MNNFNESENEIYGEDEHAAAAARHNFFFWVCSEIPLVCVAILEIAIFCLVQNSKLYLATALMLRYWNVLEK